MKLKLVGLVLAAALCIAGIWAIDRAAPERTASTSSGDLIDCTRGVACPIIWHPAMESGAGAR